MFEKRPIVGMVMDVVPHPNADKLHIAKVDVGKPERITIIFGGNRCLKTGELVPVALPGTWLPDGQKTRARNYRKIKSYGELLSYDEINGTSGGPDEVLVLSPEHYRVGESLARFPNHY